MHEEEIIRVLSCHGSEHIGLVHLSCVCLIMGLY